MRLPEGAEHSTLADPTWAAPMPVEAPSSWAAQDHAPLHAGPAPGDRVSAGGVTAPRAVVEADPVPTRWLSLGQPAQQEGTLPDAATLDRLPTQTADVPVAASADGAHDDGLGQPELADANDLATPPAPPPATLAAQAAPANEAMPSPSFVAAARRRAFWSSWPIRAVLWLVLVVLLLALALQAAISQRDWLAAREPRLAPLLVALCKPVGCALSPYRLLDAVVIDSSAFNRASGGEFRFSVVLRNTADMPVATPALELVLTDAEDRQLIRRVVTAAELGASPTLAPRDEFSGVRLLTVADPNVSSAVTGYRLMAFYP